MENSTMNRLGSVDSKEIIGGLEASFTIPTGSADTVKNKLAVENNENVIDGHQPNTDQGPITIKVEETNNGGSKSSSLTNEELEGKTSNKKIPILKSVSFRMEHQEVSEEFDALSDPSYKSYANSFTESKVLQNKSSVSSNNSLPIGTSRKSIPVLENIPEVDESLSDIDAAPGYYGWDGYEAKFEESMADYVSWSSIPGCIPPWAKSVRKKYSLSPMESLDGDQVAEPNRTLQEKLENLMKKHKELMLLKRVESKKQLIVGPNEDPNEMDTVKMRAKSTRYYMTPLILDGAKKITDVQIDENEKVSLPSLNASNSSSFSKKTSRPQAKKEISQVLKSFQKSVSKKKDNVIDREYKLRQENDKCPKITLSNIREFVNMSPDERKLHEIIKIEKVPSVQDFKERSKPFSKYIINVPKSTITDKPTVNVIKIKEKRKLRVDSIENIEEKVTELHYNQGGIRRQGKIDSDYIHRESCDTEPRRHIKTTTKSPTETKTFEVKTKQTPLLSPLVSEQDKKIEKVLMLQYDKSSKKDKRTTQLVGIKEPCSSMPGEMYLYNSETEGKRVKENLTTGQELPLTLKDKVYSIFEELRGLSLKQNVLTDSKSAEVQVCPSVDTKITQRPSHFPATTEVAMVEAKPEVRSAAVQVRQSLILEGKSDSFMLLVPHSTPTSDFQGQEEIRPSLDKDTLHEKLGDLVQDKEPLDKLITVDKLKIEDRDMEQKSLKDSQEIIKEDEPKTDTIAEVEIKSEIIKPKESVSETIKEEEKKTESDHETIKDDQSGVPEIQVIMLDPELKGEEIISEDSMKETIEQAQDNSHSDNTHSDNTHSELSKDMTKNLSRTSKELSIEKLKEPLKQLKEENPTLKIEEEMRKPSKVSSKASEQNSILQSLQDKDFEKTPTIASSERNKYLKKSYDDDETDDFFKMSFPKEHEDIRSYEFGSQQGTELIIKSSSKFLHKKDGLRKKMNWTNDTIFLENNTCPQLIRGLAETAMRQPADPISFLAHWIYKDCESRERSEQEEVRHEHLHLARAMAEVAGGDTKTRKKFNVKKYPINLIEEEKQSKVIEEEGDFPEDKLANISQTNEIVQEA